MATNLPTYALLASTVTARSSEVPLADFSGGLNLGGSNAPAIGLNTGSVNPKLQDWSVLDQRGFAREGQFSSHIGGPGTAAGAGGGFGSGFQLQVVRGADINDELTYIVAAAQAAPGVGFGPGNANPINRTDVTIEIGDRCWGTDTIA